ncbi:hypothetical protein ACFL2Y_01125 [Candidatus Omnitrophota bacterium]
MMEKKRSTGVTIFAILYLCCGVPFLFIILTILIPFFQHVLFPNRPSPSELPPLPSLIPLVLINVVFPAIPFLLTILISRGLLKLSNKIRLQLLLCNKIALALSLIGIIYTLMLQITTNYKILVIGLLLALLVFLSTSTYFFTRPKVKEQFN